MARYIETRKSTRKQSKFASVLIMAAVVAICVVAVIRVSALKSKSRELDITKQSIESQIEEANLEREALIAREQYMKTNQYIEDVAKDKLGLVYPDEIVIRPAE